MYSLVRIDNARIVHVGFLSACDTKGPPSATNKFLQSCAWHQRFVTEVFGSSPMRAPPSSWMMTPPAAMPYPCSAPGIGENGIAAGGVIIHELGDRKSTRLNSSHTVISYAVFCL